MLTYIPLRLLVTTLISVLLLTATVPVRDGVVGPSSAAREQSSMIGEQFSIPRRYASETTVPTPTTPRFEDYRTQSPISNLPHTPQARTITYTYDDAGRLIGADYGEGAQLIYGYDAAGNLEHVSDHYGVFLPVVWKGEDLP